MHMAVLLSQLMMGVVLLLVILLPFVAYGQTIADSFRGDVRSCETSCESSFPGSDESERMMFSFCRRGCRLLNLIDTLDDFSNLNDTKHACFKSCRDSYSDESNVKACLFGCESQLPTAEHRKQQMKEYYYSQNLQNLSPTLYVNKLYSNMIEKVGDQMSRSYYSQTINGGLVVVAAKSSVVADANDNPFGGDSYNFMETRGVVFGAVDMSALDANGQQLAASNGQRVLENRLDSELVWRTCIIVKAGTSRLLIICLVILLVMLAGWIWASSPIVTEKGHQTLLEEGKLKQLACAAVAQGDLQYLLLNDEAMKSPCSILSLKTVDVVAAPLPIKLKIGSV